MDVDDLETEAIGHREDLTPMTVTGVRGSTQLVAGPLGQVDEVELAAPPPHEVPGPGEDRPEQRGDARHLAHGGSEPVPDPAPQVMEPEEPHPGADRPVPTQVPSHLLDVGPQLLVDPCLIEGEPLGVVDLEIPQQG